MTTAIEHLSEAWRGREVAWQVGRRDLRLRYRQTRLGFAWLFAGPVVNALLFTFVFHRIGKISTGKTPYFVFSLTGLAAWTLFFQAASRVAGSFVASVALVTRVRFPRLCLPMSAVISAGADGGVALLIALVGVIVIVPSWRIVPGLAGAFVALVFLAVTAFALGLLVAVLSVRRRDLAQALPILLQLGLYASPVGYPPSAVPHSFRFILDINPVATGVTSFRFFLLGGEAPTYLQILGAGLVVIGLLLLALGLFRRVEPSMADVL